MLPPTGELYIVYVPQLGFLDKLLMPPIDESDLERVGAAYTQVGLAFQFNDANDYYFKSVSCQSLDACAPCTAGPRGACACALRTSDFVITYMRGRPLLKLPQALW